MNFLRWMSAVNPRAAIAIVLAVVCFLLVAFHDLIWAGLALLIGVFFIAASWARHNLRE